MRDELLVKLQAVDVGDAHAVTKELMARLDRARAKLAAYDRLLADMLDGRDEEVFERDAERIGPYLTLMGGRMYEQTNIDWCTCPRVRGDRRGAQQSASILNVAVTSLLGLSVKFPSADPVIVYLPPTPVTSALPMSPQ